MTITQIIALGTALLIALLIGRACSGPSIQETSFHTTTQTYTPAPRLTTHSCPLGYINNQDGWCYKW